MMWCEGCLSSQRSFDREEDTCTGRGGEAGAGGGSVYCLLNIVTQLVSSLMLGCVCAVCRCVYVYVCMCDALFPLSTYSLLCDL